MRGGSLLLFFCSCFIFSLPLRSDRGRFSRLLCFSSLSLLLFVFFGCSDGMEREACVCDHGYERSDLCAEIIIIISPILLENPDFLTGWGYQKILLEKDFKSYRMTVSQP